MLNGWMRSNNNGKPVFPDFPLLEILKVWLVPEVAVQDWRIENRLVATGVFFGRFEMHGGLAVPSQLVQRNGFVEMRFSEG